MLPALHSCVFSRLPHSSQPPLCPSNPASLLAIQPFIEPTRVTCLHSAPKDYSTTVAALRMVEDRDMDMERLGELTTHFPGMHPALSGREWVFLATVLAYVSYKLPVMCQVPVNPSVGNKELSLPLRFHPGQMRSGFQSLLK